ncbi:MAG: hypothetical protein IJT12_04000 [Paludibacteraceae bacterium]|nr:hypothetical protein [Paludibacteraceae bacterium]
MNTQKFSNENGSYPVSTRTFELLQEDIHLALNSLARVAGIRYAIIRMPTQAGNYEDGLCIFDYEVMPLHGRALNSSYRYIQVTSSVETVTAARTYTDIRTVRYATYGAYTSGAVDISSFTIIQDSHTLLGLYNRITTVRTELLAEIGSLAGTPVGGMIDWVCPDIGSQDRYVFGYYYPASVFPAGFLPVGKLLVRHEDAAAYIASFDDLLTDGSTIEWANGGESVAIGTSAGTEWGYVYISEVSTPSGVIKFPNPGQFGSNGYGPLIHV